MIDNDRIFELLPDASSERRRYPRVDLARACKLRIGPSLYYRPGVTSDVSAGGVRVTVDGDIDDEVGSTVLLAVSWHGHPTVTHGETIPARVVRVERGEDRSSVALAFESPIVMASILASPRAA
ncbi:MAG: PilZ domain-containing protein [Planctomycetota bacterium]